MLTQQQILQASKFSIRNREQIMNSNIVGCYCCLKIYDKNELVEWIDGGDSTALCAYCSVDSVLGDASPYPITKENLIQLKTYWFSPADK